MKKKKIFAHLDDQATIETIDLLRTIATAI